MTKYLTLDELKNLNVASLEARKVEILSLVDKYLDTSNKIIARLNKYNIEYTYSDPTFEVWVEADGIYSSLYIGERPQLKVGILNIICLDKGFCVELLTFLNSNNKPKVAPYNVDGGIKFPLKDIDIVILKAPMFAYKFSILADDVRRMERLKENFGETYNRVFEFNDEQGLYEWSVDEYDEDCPEYFDYDDEDSDYDEDDED